MNLKKINTHLSEVKTKMKKIKMFGKMVPLALLVGILVIGTGSAALLSYFGQITTTADVEQSILLDGQAWDASISHTIPEASPGGEEFCYKHTLENRMSINGSVNLETSDIIGIDTNAYDIPETTTLQLCSKDTTSWQCNPDMSATLIFKTSNPEFDYELSYSGLSDGVEYAIIYYADKAKRFNYWGGDNPGEVIDTFTADSTGNHTNSVDIGMNLPANPDWNINPNPDYCDYNNNFDDYVHCRGAKIWIVPTSDLTSGDLPVAWNPSSYLFETDLVMYFDCNEQTEDDISRLASYYKGSELSKPITIASGDIKNFLLCYDFDPLIAPNVYSIVTTVVSA